MADLFNKSNQKYDAQHIIRMNAIEQKIKVLYLKATQQAALLSKGVKKLGDKPFVFDNYPALKKEADDILQELGQGMEATILNGVQAEWTLSNSKNDALTRLVFGNKMDKLTKEQQERYFKNNDDALQSFLQRKTAGLNLSDRVWKYTNCFKDEIEMALDLGIRSGKSAAELSRDVRDYLQHPNKLFRRVRDEHGNLQLSKAAKQFHPGQGVYRSSYMNARRLASTEINIAYKTADYLRWQDLDFVVGIRICLSNNHNCKGVPAGMFFDICDELKGVYPKDFKFVPWHPHCRCHAETILKTPAELQLDTDRILAGRPTAKYSRNTVKEVPDQFQNWVKNNKDRILTAEGTKSMPYFLKDNASVYQNILGMEKPQTVIADRQRGEQIVRRQTIAERAAARHATRTETQIESITKEWDIRRLTELEKQWMAKDISRKGAGFDLCNDARTKLYTGYDHKTVRDLIDQSEQKLNILKNAAARHAARTVDDMRRIQDLADVRKYGQGYVDNIHEIENALGMKRSKRMTHKEANTGKVNPNYDRAVGYDINCSTCSATYYMRRLGFDVSAKPNIAANKKVRELSQGITVWDKWIGGKWNYNSISSWKISNQIRVMDSKAYMEFINEYTKEDGIYEFVVGYRSGGGHSTLLVREEGKLYRIEQQCGPFKKRELTTLLATLDEDPHYIRGIFRIDNAQFNKDYVDIFEKPKRPKKP